MAIQTEQLNTVSQIDDALEDELNCSICFELLVDPTTLTCGHTICRYCLAQWWCSSEKNTCPDCRQVWVGFPEVNVTLRNIIDVLFKKKITKRKTALTNDLNCNEVIDEYERFHGRSRRKRDNRPWIAFDLGNCLFALSSVIIIAIWNHYGSLDNLMNDVIPYELLLNTDLSTHSWRDCVPITILMVVISTFSSAFSFILADGKIDRKFTFLSMLVGLFMSAVLCSSFILICLLVESKKQQKH